jgi:2'-5' RNA ligase
MSNNYLAPAPAPKWSQYGFQEYLLVLNPSSDVNEKVMKEKKLFSNDYNYRMAGETHPHITLGVFLARESMEEELISLLQRVCNRHTRFTVALNNFSGFPPHTIYIKVKNPKPFEELMKSLELLDRYLYKEKCRSLQLSGTPHLTIARQLPEDVYLTAIQTYVNRTFNEVFTASKLVLLKRDSQLDKCEVVNTFNLPPESKNLFN